MLDSEEQRDVVLNIAGRICYVIGMIIGFVLGLQNAGIGGAIIGIILGRMGGNLAGLFLGLLIIGILSEAFLSFCLVLIAKSQFI